MFDTDHAIARRAHVSPAALAEKSYAGLGTVEFIPEMQQNNEIITQADRLFPPVQRSSYVELKGECRGSIRQLQGFTIP